MSSCHCIYCTPSLFPVLNYLYKKGVPSLQLKFLIGTGNFRNQKALWLQTYGCVHVHSVYSDFEHKEPSISSVSIQFWTQRAEIRILFTLDSWLLDSTHLERWRREIQKKKRFSVKCQRGCCTDPDFQWERHSQHVCEFAIVGVRKWVESQCGWF